MIDPEALRAVDQFVAALEAEAAMECYVAVAIIYKNKNNDGRAKILANFLGVFTTEQAAKASCHAHAKVDALEWMSASNASVQMTQFKGDINRATAYFVAHQKVKDE